MDLSQVTRKRGAFCSSMHCHSHSNVLTNAWHFNWYNPVRSDSLLEDVLLLYLVQMFCLKWENIKTVSGVSCGRLLVFNQDMTHIPVNNATG